MALTHSFSQNSKLAIVCPHTIDTYLEFKLAFFENHIQNIFTSDYIQKSILNRWYRLRSIPRNTTPCFHLYTQRRQLYNSPVLTLNIVTIYMGTHVSHGVHVARIAIHICVYTGRTTWHILIRAVAHVTRVHYSATANSLRDSRRHLNQVEYPRVYSSQQYRIRMSRSHPIDTHIPLFQKITPCLKCDRFPSIHVFFK